MILNNLKESYVLKKPNNIYEVKEQILDMLLDRVNISMKNIIDKMNSLYPISDETIQILKENTVLCHFPKRYQLIEADKFCKSAYFIEEGMTRSFWLVNGEEITTSFAYEGSIVFSMDELYYNKISEEFVETLEEVAQSSVPRNADSRIYHASNVANNYGLVFQGTDFYVIDLTNDTVYKSGTVNISFTDADVLYHEGKFKFCTLGREQSQNYIYEVAYSDLALTTYAFDDWRVNCCGWVSESKIWGGFVPSWFYQYRDICGIDGSGTTIWQVQAQTGGSGGFPNLNFQGGWGANGYLWIPCLKYGKWRMGAFPWSGNNDFESPKPVKIFGTFPTRPWFDPSNRYAVMHNQGRSKVSFATDLGVYLGDYHDLIKLTDDVLYPVALDDSTVVCTDGVKTYIYKG